jgi:FkbM family methyltransferase
MFISYAQNFEDVILWRAFKTVACGFYIDVGASDPASDSVTKAFYARGWRGINIEPERTFFDRLVSERPEDINLRIAVSAAKGVAPFYEVSRKGLSTLRPELISAHQEAGYEVRAVDIETDTLAEICERHVAGPIHFLKIDVEGSEQDVLAGMDFRRWRPWIVVVEATLPNSAQPSYQAWEEIVTGAGYVFAYSDGLNRFYVAQEHNELLGAFRYPPNVFDDFVQVSEHEARERADRAEVQVSALVARVERAEGEAARAGERAARAADEVVQSDRNMLVWQQRAEHYSYRLREREALLEATFRSRSWRLTAPYRKLGEIIPRRPHRSRARPLPSPARPTFFVECTHTFHSDLNTGIQRVVRNVLRHAPAAATPHGYDVVPVILEGDRFVPTDLGRVLADKSRPAASSAAEPVRGLSQAKVGARGLWRLLLRTLSTVMPFKVVRRFLYAGPDRFGLAWCVLLPLRVAGLRPWPERAAEIPGPDSLDDYESLQGSVLVLLDSSWTFPIWRAVGRFRKRGGKIAGVIYDLVPITHPHTSVPVLTVAFEAWLKEHVRHTEAFIGISRSTADDLRRYLDRLAPTRGRRGYAIDHFHLGSELDFVGSGDLPHPEIERIFAGERHVFLTVGSFEPRKNHSYVLDAFETHWAEGGDSVIVMIGRQAWKTDDFLERVARHEQLGRRLFMVRDASDADLDYAYRTASALVIASEIEGFGLPVVEAFQRGLPVLCSDIPVFREIADGKATFFDLVHTDSLAEAIAEFCRIHDVASRGVRVPQSWITWRESADQLIAAIVRTLSLQPVAPAAAA